MAYGLTDEGFADKPLEVIKTEIETAQRAAIGPKLNTSSASPLGQINGIFSSKLRELWEVMLAVYSATDPDAASRRALDNVAAITGTLRAAAQKSTVVLTVSLNAGAVLPAGSVASVSGNAAARFTTLEEVENPGASPATFDVDAEAEEAGEVIANSGTLTVIETPVTGWTAVTNATDATVGSEVEEDDALRIRREQELRVAGRGTVESIRADLLALTAVREVVVFENTTMATNGDGLPPKSFEAVVRGTLENTEEDEAVAEQIWLSKPAGIESYGSTDVEVFDSLGTSQTVYFSRPDPRDVWLEVDLVVNTRTYPSDGDIQVRDAIVALGDAELGIGDDVVLSKFYCAIFAIPGVEDVSEIRAGFSASPVGTSNLTIAARELAELDTSRVLVSS